MVAHAFNPSSGEVEAHLADQSSTVTAFRAQLAVFLQRKPNPWLAIKAHAPEVKPRDLIHRSNMIADLGELAKLRDLPKLRALVMLDNPCADETDYRQEALVQMANLERLDKEFFEDEDRAEAEEIRQRLKEEQEQDLDADHDMEPYRPPS